MKQRRRLAIVALALLGTGLGVASGNLLGRATLLRTATSGLSAYADELIAHAQDYDREINTIRKAFNPSKYPFCSPQEIAEMQTMTYRSPEIKEIGRTRDGVLECSAFLGRLKPGWPEQQPSLAFGDGTRIYTNVPLMIADRTPGIIIETDGVSVVIGPAAFDHWNRPGMRYMVDVVSRKKNQVLRIAGAKFDVDPAWILSQGTMRSPGPGPKEIYLSRCSSYSPICIVTAQSTAELMVGEKPLLLEYMALGGLAGFSLCLALGQFYVQRVGLAQQLRRAIRKDALTLVYQPVLNLPSRSCAGAEALVRWSDEDGVPVAADLFVRIAEDSGFIGELTALVVRRATAEVGEILRKDRALTLSINIAASDLEGDALFLLLEEHVERTGIFPRQIALELTERSTTDLAVLRYAVMRLHEHGYQVHIDDFGSGFSSLAYLHELAVDAIKIDRTFTRTIGTDAVTASILPQILALAESLQLEVIVEGVETEAQAQYLEHTGRHMQAQGWHFGKPVSARDLPKYRELVETPRD